jgi:hypothetical protein
MCVLRLFVLFSFFFIFPPGIIVNNGVSREAAEAQTPPQQQR